jgi:hypothetical protein
MSKNNQNNQNEIKVLGQGTYGCAVEPHRECGRQGQVSNGFLSKIQPNNKTTDNEIVIGEKLSRYTDKFAPIINACPLTTGKIQQDILKKCDKLDKTKEAMITSKIRYVGKETLDTFLQNIISMKSKDKSTKYLKQIINKHLFLLESLEVLNRENVLHLDIKSDNIMIDDTTKRPIIIDFGISYDASKLQIEEYKKTTEPFGIIIDYYTPWCFEIILLTHISRYLIGKKDGKSLIIDAEKEKRKITSDEIAKLKSETLEKFIKKNTILQMSIFTDAEKQEYLSRLQNMINGFEGKTWTEIWNIIIATKDTWDNYGLSVMILSELQISGLIQISENNTKNSFNDYIQVLKNILLGINNTPKETIIKITKLFGNMKKKDYTKVAGELEHVFKDKNILYTMGVKRNAVKEKTIIEKDMLTQKLKAKTI